jgi:anti-sigma factor RsiW
VNCREFETQIDFYLDGVLDAPSFRVAADHVSVCPKCETMVTDAQQVSALLKTAVSDRIAAVDVSGLWDSIERELGPVPARSDAAGQVRTPQASGWLNALHAGWSSLVEWASGASGAWLPVGRGSIGALAAGAAVFALVVGSLVSGPDPIQVADSRGRSKTKSVRIESLEVPAGATVSTWKRPRSRTQFISVTTADGFGVSNAGFAPIVESSR